MKRSTQTRAAFLSLIAVAALAVPYRADAQCAFDNRSPKAKSVKMSLVRAADSCPGLVIPGTNTVTTDGILACSPPPYLSSYTFGDGGKCDVTVLHKAASGEACAPASECSEMTLSAHCSGILSPAATPIDAESGWRLAINMRNTIDDTANGDMTMIELPFAYEFPDASSGKIDLKVKGTALDLDYLSPPAAFDVPLVRCMSVQLSPIGSFEPIDDYFGGYTPFAPSVRILDPAGNVFASFGSSIGTAAAGSCAINLGARTKGIKGSFVRATRSCPFGSFATSNTTTSVGIPACAPPTALSEFPERDFDPRNGGCKIAIRQVGAPCASSPTETCAPLSIDLRCSGIIADDYVGIDESGWRLSLIVRLTLADSVAGEVTAVDFPAYIDLPSIVKGKVKLKTTLNELATSGPPPNVLGLPGCASLQIVEAALLDASGNKFARLGTAVFPKN